jgi:hypothetical protein
MIVLITRTEFASARDSSIHCSHCQLKSGREVKITDPVVTIRQPIACSVGLAAVPRFEVYPYWVLALCVSPLRLNLNLDDQARCRAEAHDPEKELDREYAALVLVYRCGSLGWTVIVLSAAIVRPTEP